MEVDQANRHPPCGDLYRAASAEPDGMPQAACLDDRMRSLLTASRLHAKHARLLLERAEADGFGDEAQQMRFQRMSEHLRQGDLSGLATRLEGRGVTYV